MRGALLVVLAAAAASGAARADDEPTARCSLRIIRARHDDGEWLDPQIKLLRPYLEQEPFDDWKQFKLLKVKEATLAPHASDTEVLPNGRNATFTYVGHQLSPEGKHRVRMRLEIAQADRKELMKTEFFVDEGKPFLYALQRKPTAQSEMLILGISCELPH
jgi:hypothetical protein